MYFIDHIDDQSLEKVEVEPTTFQGGSVSVSINATRTTITLFMTYAQLESISKQLEFHVQNLTKEDL